MHTYDYYLPYFEIPLNRTEHGYGYDSDDAVADINDVMEMMMRPTDLTDSSLLKNFIFSINLQYCGFWISVTKNIVDDIVVIIIIIVMLPLCSLIYDPVPGTMTLSICFETCHQNDFKPSVHILNVILWKIGKISHHISLTFTSDVAEEGFHPYHRSNEAKRKGKGY